MCPITEIEQKHKKMIRATKKSAIRLAVCSYYNALSLFSI